MTSKPKRRATSGDFRDKEEVAADLDVDRYLSENRDEIDAKLREARGSIARGKAVPLEPLSDLLRVARRRAKGAA